MKKRIIAGVLTAGMIFTVGCTPKLETTGITIDSFMEDMLNKDLNQFVNLENLADNAETKEGKGGISQYTSEADLEYDGIRVGDSEINAEIETKTNEIISLEMNISLSGDFHSAMMKNSEDGATVAFTICKRLYDCAEIICDISEIKADEEAGEVIKDIINNNEDSNGETTRSYNGYKVTFSAEDTFGDFTIKIEMEENEEEL